MDLIRNTTRLLSSRTHAVLMYHHRIVSSNLDSIRVLSTQTATAEKRDTTLPRSRSLDKRKSLSHPHPPVTVVAKDTTLPRYLSLDKAKRVKRLRLRATGAARATTQPRCRSLDKARRAAVRPLHRLRAIAVVKGMIPVRFLCKKRFCEHASCTHGCIKVGVEWPC